MSAARRPSFLFITTDQQRADTLGCMGNAEVHTPHLDALARRGSRFDSAFVANPLCMPARASLLTGRYPSSHGVRVNGIDLPDHERTVAHHLRAAGYRTSAIGKLHLSAHLAGAEESLESLERWRHPSASDWTGPYYGFERVELVLSHHSPDGHYGRWLDAHHPGVDAMMREERDRRMAAPAPDCWVSDVPEESHTTTWVAERTMEELARFRDDDFFLWCSFPDPHHPFAPPKRYAEMYDPPGLRQPSRREGELDARPPHFRDFYERGTKFEGTQRGIVPSAISPTQHQMVRAHYYGAISFVDEAVGRLLARLDSLGLAERTVVVFTSDHGELLGDHGLLFKGPFLYEGLIRVPLIWHDPRTDQVPATSALVSHVDVMATIMAAAGLAIPNSVQGSSFDRLLVEPSARHRDAVVVEFHSEDHPGLVLRALRTERWKLVAYAGGRWGELTDLAADPDEHVNLYGAPHVREQQCELERRLLAEMLAASDRRLVRTANA